MRARISPRKPNGQAPENRPFGGLPLARRSPKDNVDKKYFGLKCFLSIIIENYRKIIESLRLSGTRDNFFLWEKSCKKAKILAGFIGFVSAKSKPKECASPRRDVCSLPRKHSAEPQGRVRFTDSLRTANAREARMSFNYWRVCRGDHRSSVSRGGICRIFAQKNGSF